MPSFNYCGNYSLINYWSNILNHQFLRQGFVVGGFFESRSQRSMDLLCGADEPIRQWVIHIASNLNTVSVICHVVARKKPLIAVNPCNPLIFIIPLCRWRGGRRGVVVARAFPAGAPVAWADLL